MWWELREKKGERERKGRWRVRGREDCFVDLVVGTVSRTQPKLPPSLFWLWVVFMSIIRFHLSTTKTTSTTTSTTTKSTTSTTTATIIPVKWKPSKFCSVSILLPSKKCEPKQKKQKREMLKMLMLRFWKKIVFRKREETRFFPENSFWTENFLRHLNYKLLNT